MSSSEAERLLARQDRAARAEARRAKQERQAAREAAELEAKRAEQARLVAEAKAAREAGAMDVPSPPCSKTGLSASPGRTRDVLAIADRLAAKAARDESDAANAKAEAKRKAAEKASGVGPKVVKAFKQVKNPFRPEEFETVAVNLAEHPLEMMLSRRRLSQALYEAGIRYRSIYERAEIGPGRGIDPSRMKVDGGSLGDPLSDSVISAQFELKRLARELGPVGERIVAQVAGRGMTVADLASCWPGHEDLRTKRDYLTMRLKEALDVLASEVWGAKGPRHGKISGARELGSGVIDAKAVETANQSYLRKRGIAL